MVTSTVKCGGASRQKKRDQRARERSRQAEKACRDALARTF